MTDNRNIFADRWDELYNSLPSEKKNRIDKIEENGLVYMRARYYSPTFKRFINADVVADHST